MTRRVLFALLASALPIGAAQGLDFYIIDVGQGNATLIVASSGQTMLFDAAPRRMAGRVLGVLKEAGVQQIDYLVVSHYHEDHMGGVADIAEKVKVRNFLDHGPSLEFGKNEDWWKGLKGDQYRPGMAKTYDEMIVEYNKTIQKGRHVVVNPGDKIPLQGVDVLAVLSRGKGIAGSLKGGGAANSACAGTELRLDDYEEDGQSIGLLFTLGRFRFAQLGDLTWNLSHRFFCPNNPIGRVDAYVVTHHARSYPKEAGENSWSLSSCPKEEVHGLDPRIAILSGGRGAPIRRADALAAVRSSPGLEDLWQTGAITTGPEKEYNSRGAIHRQYRGGRRPASLH